MSRTSAWEVAWELARERRSPPWAAAGQALDAKSKNLTERGAPATSLRDLTNLHALCAHSVSIVMLAGTKVAAPRSRARSTSARAAAISRARGKMRCGSARAITRLACLFILSLAPHVSSHVYSLDARGVDEVMQKGRATVIKFTTSEPGEEKSLNELWAQLDNDFRTSGLVFASVDCQQTPEACAARKIGVETALPIVKFWNPDPNVNAFRRYSGPNELNALRTYLAKKLAEMPESLVRAHVNTYEAEARAKEERNASTRSKRQRSDRQRKLFDPAETGATLAGRCTALSARRCYRSRLPIPLEADRRAAGRFDFVGSASTPLRASALCFSPSTQNPLQPPQPQRRRKEEGRQWRSSNEQWRLEPSVYARIGRNAMPPSPLNISIGRRRRIGATFILHHGTSTSAEVDGRTEDFSSIRTVCIDPTASGTPVMEVESKVLPYDVPPVIHVLCMLKRGRPRSGVRIDLLATAAADGSVRAVHVPTPIVLPPIEPGYFERFSRWIATTFLLPKPPVPRTSQLYPAAKSDDRLR